MAILSNNNIARAIYLFLKDKSHSEQLDMSQKIVKFLSRRRLLSKASLILSQLGKIINQEEGRIIVKVSSVEKLNQQTKIHLEQALKKRYSAKEIMLVESLDSKLLGGLKVEVNNEIIDLSIKNKIGKLQKYLTKSV
ncbi:MAG: ATP synthase subunit delta [Parcubacteria group bacterium GW2011_GWA2_36_24]|nr:MAG: ATP synthase subunit delta [Parcubacteria group bacterium GW2011_GWA2_36_24]